MRDRNNYTRTLNMLAASNRLLSWNKGHSTSDSAAGFDANGRALGRMRSTGLRPKFLEKMAHANVKVDPMLFATDRL